MPTVLYDLRFALRGFRRARGFFATAVLIVSESVARRLWPGRDPIGQRIRIPGASPNSIVGGER